MGKKQNVIVLHCVLLLVAAAIDSAGSIHPVAVLVQVIAADGPYRAAHACMRNLSPPSSLSVYILHTRVRSSFQCVRRRKEKEKGEGCLRDCAKVFSMHDSKTAM